MLWSLVLLASLGTTLAGYADSGSNSVGNGAGVGYGGSFSGTGGNIPVPPIPNFDFSGIWNGYFDSLQKYHQNLINNGPYSYSIAYSGAPNAKVEAHSSITYVDNYSLQQQAQLAQNGAPAGAQNFGQNFPAAAGSGGSLASASIGPQGGYQSAAVFPENANSPNIFNRFAETSQSGSPEGGNYGVFTSSVSSSSNLNGKPQSFHQASTTINDNGKVSTYTVKNP